MPTSSTPPLRPTTERIAAVRARLAHDRDAWVASADAAGEAYLIPLSFQWDGTALTFATPAASRTARNLRRAARTRIGLESTEDVVLIDGTVAELALDADPALTTAFVARAGFDPRAAAGEYVLLRLTPERIQTWRTEPELHGRDVMRGGTWLGDAPEASDAPGPSGGPGAPGQPGHPGPPETPPEPPEPRDWNAEIIAEVRRGGGVVAAPYPDPPPMLLLHTIGARTGKEHVVPMRGLAAGETLYVFATAHGSDRHPDWYHNLVAHPEFEVELGTETIPVHATVLPAAERESVLARWLQRVPLVADVLAKTDRVVPVIRLTRRPEDPR